jgi:spore coat polysaccharide biosynthesis protein SpsF (cytidylyltransferase family)
MRVTAIIEARMGSTRLPGKTMLPVKGKPLLSYMLERVWAAELIDSIVVATPSTPDNKPIWDLVEKYGDGKIVKCVKGATKDVLGRVVKAARETKADVIVELTGDCPLIDPHVIDIITGYYLVGEWDFVGNVSPRTWAKGMDVRVFDLPLLEGVDRLVTGTPREAYWREHVSPFIYEQAGEYKCLNLTAEEMVTYPELNLSVDTLDDFRRVKNVLEALHAGNPNFNNFDIIEFLATLPGHEMLSAPRPTTPEQEASWMAR